MINVVIGGVYTVNVKICLNVRCILLVCMYVKLIFIWKIVNEGMHSLSYIAVTIIKVCVFRFASSLWITLVHPGSLGSWSLRMTVDLSVRSDTGKINQSPVSSVASTIILSQICSLSDLTFYIPGKRYILFCGLQFY